MVRAPILLAGILLFSACNGETDDNASKQDEAAQPVVSEPTSETPAEATPTTQTATTPAAAPAKDLPWGLPHMPDARYRYELGQFSKPRGSHGGEATAVIIFKGDALEIVEFFESAASENGFTVTQAQHNDASGASLDAKRSSGEHFMVSAATTSYTKEGETAATLIFQRPKP